MNKIDNRLLYTQIRHMQAQDFEKDDWSNKKHLLCSATITVPVEDSDGYEVICIISIDIGRPFLDYDLKFLKLSLLEKKEEMSKKVPTHKANKP